MADDAEIEFYPAGCPRSAHGDRPEFNGIIAIDKLLSGFFIDRPPDLTADFRQNGQPDIFIFKSDHRPFFVSCSR